MDGCALLSTKNYFQLISKTVGILISNCSEWSFVLDKGIRHSTPKKQVDYICELINGILEFTANSEPLSVKYFATALPLECIEFVLCVFFLNSSYWIH